MSNIKQIFTKIKSGEQTTKKEVEKVIYKQANGTIQTLHEFTEDLMVVVYIESNRYKIGFLSGDTITNSYDFDTSLFMDEAKLVELFNKFKSDDEKITNLDALTINSIGLFKLFYGGGYWFFIFSFEFNYNGNFRYARIISCIKTNYLVAGDFNKMSLIGVAEIDSSMHYSENALSQYLYQNGKSYFFSDGQYCYIYNHATKEVQRSAFDTNTEHYITGVAYGQGYVCCVEPSGRVGYNYGDYILVSNDECKTFKQYKLSDIVGDTSYDFWAYNIWYNNKSKRFYITIATTSSYEIYGFNIIDGEIQSGEFATISSDSSDVGYFSRIGSQEYMFIVDVNNHLIDIKWNSSGWTTTSIDVYDDISYFYISIANNPFDDKSYMINGRTGEIFYMNREGYAPLTFSIMSSLMSDKRFVCVAYSNQKNNTMIYDDKTDVFGRY